MARPYVYRPGKRAAAALGNDEGAATPPVTGRRRLRSVAEIAHGLEIVDFRVALHWALAQREGEILVWLGEAQATYRIPGRGRGLPFTPDAYCRWTLGGTEGAFFLECDRGTESMNRLSEKLTRYDAYYQLKAYRDHLGSVGLCPRIVFLVEDARRRDRLVDWAARNLAKGSWASLPTLLVATQDEALADPLGSVWMRPSSAEPTRLTDPRH